MAAKPGNKNAVGNRGRGSKEQEALITKFKGLILVEAIKIMEKGTKQEKDALILRSITSVLPRTIEGSGEEGEFLLRWLNK